MSPAVEPMAAEHVPARTRITGLVLAGGRGSRLGGIDKGLLPINGLPMIEHVVGRLRPQVAEIIVSANRNIERYREFGWRVVADEVDDSYKGPLAGILSGLRGARTDWIVTAPCDAPLVSEQLVARLTAAVSGNTTAVVAHDGERMQQAFLLLNKSLIGDLATYLAGGERALGRWLRRQRFREVSFADRPQAFANVNNACERDAIEARLRGAASAC
jgi:molybdopterin-guanine dinucleotide biosynthesis protein A